MRNYFLFINILNTKFFENTYTFLIFSNNIVYTLRIFIIINNKKQNNILDNMKI